MIFAPVTRMIPNEWIPLITISLISISLIVFYFFRLRCPVRLFHRKGLTMIQYRSPIDHKAKKIPLDQLIKICCPSLTKPNRNVFTMHPMLFNGHLQTLYASVYADYIATTKVTFTREFLNTPDGGIVSLDWTDEPEPHPNGPTPYVFILHGLTGGSHETYVQDLVAELKKYGYRAIVMNFRGCSETPVQSAQLYSGSFTGDVEMCLTHIQKRAPTAVLFGCGFSLGSNVLTKYCGKMGANCPLIGMVSVDNPYDFLGSMRALERTFIGRNLYSYHMGRNLVKLFTKHQDAFRNCEWLDFREIANAKSIIEFDAAATSKSFGYRTVHEYYRFGSCAHDIPYITIPGLFLSALDDPVSNQEVIPYYEFQSNPNLILATTSCGGHLGWFKWNGALIPQQRWFQTPVAEFVHAIIESHLSLPSAAVNKEKNPLTGTPWYSMPLEAAHAREELFRLLQRKTNDKDNKEVQTDGLEKSVTEVGVATDTKPTSKLVDKQVSTSSTVAAPTVLDQHPKKNRLVNQSFIQWLKESRLYLVFFIIVYAITKRRHL